MDKKCASVVYLHMQSNLRKQIGIQNNKRIEPVCFTQILTAVSSQMNNRPRNTIADAVTVTVVIFFKYFSLRFYLR